MSMLLTILLILLLMAALWTVITRTLLVSAIGLAVTSAILTIIMFLLDAPLAAVFELSICSGLITVVFISTISLTHSHPTEISHSREKDFLKWYWLLPVILILLSFGLAKFPFAFGFNLFRNAVPLEVRQVLWEHRLLDILGQIVIILAGVFGIVTLFKERKQDDKS
jgi:NADH-quinone oxidoreductase subunit J